MVFLASDDEEDKDKLEATAPHVTPSEPSTGAAARDNDAKDSPDTADRLAEQRYLRDTCGQARLPARAKRRPVSSGRLLMETDKEPKEKKEEREEGKEAAHTRSHLAPTS